MIFLKKIANVLVLTIFVNALSFSQPLHKYKDIPELYDSVIFKFGSLVFQSLTENEKKVFRKTGVKITNFVDDGYVPYQKPEFKTFIIYLPEKLGMLVWKDFSVFMTCYLPQLVDRMPLREYYISFYEIADLQYIDPVSFLALPKEQLRYVKDSFSTYYLYRASENTILFLLLHEVAHVFLKSIHKQGAKVFSENDISDEAKCDAWAFRRLISYCNRYRIPIYNDLVLTPIRETMEVILKRDESASFFRYGRSSRIDRILNFLRIAKDNICGLGVGSEKMCKEINHQINVAQQEGENLKRQYLGMVYYKQQVRDFTDLLNCKRQLDTLLFSRNSDLISDVCDKYLMDFIKKAHLTVGYYLNLYLVADAMRNGQWGFSENLEKSLALYEAIANTSKRAGYYHISTFGYQELQNKMNVVREHCALSAAIIYEYKFKNIQKAVYYYTLASSSAVRLKPSFYKAKVEKLMAPNIN